MSIILNERNKLVEELNKCEDKIKEISMSYYKDKPQKSVEDMYNKEPCYITTPTSDKTIREFECTIFFLFGVIVTCCMGYRAGANIGDIIASLGLILLIIIGVYLIIWRQQTKSNETRKKLNKLLADRASLSCKLEMIDKIIENSSQGGE